MAIKLETGHAWDVGQTFGRMPDNLDDNFTVPDKTWRAVIVDTRTGSSIVRSELAATRAEAIADAERKYTRR